MLLASLVKIVSLKLMNVHPILAKMGTALINAMATAVNVSLTTR